MCENLYRDASAEELLECFYSGVWNGSPSVPKIYNGTDQFHERTKQSEADGARGTDRKKQEMSLNDSLKKMDDLVEKLDRLADRYVALEAASKARQTARKMRTEGIEK